MVEKSDIERFVEGGAQAINAGDWDAYGALFARDVVIRSPGAPEGTVGREARVAFGRAFAKAFPDARVEPVRAFTEGDLVCMEVRFRGTHDGPMITPGGEIAATGRVVEFPYCIVARFDGGEVAEMDEYFDQLAMLRQLGAA
jgi:steroid delta-isomerase-like uncharacterized protein